MGVHTIENSLVILIIVKKMNQNKMIIQGITGQYLILRPYIPIFVIMVHYEAIPTKCCHYWVIRCRFTKRLFSCGIHVD